MRLLFLQQAFNTNSSSWSTLTAAIPDHFGRLAAVLYDSRIIVLGANFNGLFDPETGQWATDEGRRLAGGGGGAGVSDFGMCVDDGRLYVLGGRRYNADKYETTDEVKSVEVALACVAGRALTTSDWRPHARLPRPSVISVCGLLDISSDV